MTKTRIALVTILIIALLASIWGWRHRRVPEPAGASPVPQTKSVAVAEDVSPTTVYAHNLRLRKGPDFRVYVRWIRGMMVATHPRVIPSLDDPDSFVLQIQKGVIRANIGDIGNFFNVNAPADAALKNISVQPVGQQVKIRGTMRKVFPLPVELVGSLSTAPGGRVRFQATRISVLKLPMKGLLGTFHIKLSDLVHATNIPGIEMQDNSILFDTQRLLPPPHIHGMLTAVNIKPPDIEVVYGNAPDDDAELAQWHNFLRLRGGSVGFGKLTMRDADLTMIDASHSYWFDLDLVNYQKQLVRGYSRMTADGGLEIFMPDVGGQMPAQITLDWLKDRNRAVPFEAHSKQDAFSDRRLR